MAATRSSDARKVRELKRHPVRPGLGARAPKGRLLIIGGHEDAKHDKLILRALTRETNGGKLVVATLASEQPDAVWARYESAFRSLGVRHLYHLKIESRADAETPRAMSILDGATTVFFTGGDQLRLTALIGDTPVFSRCYELYAAGGTIAGTSAGASVLSETMLVAGGSESSHRIGDALRMAPGLGFARGMVIDQHFAERGRIGRLLGVVAQNPRILGVGIDENTAIEMTGLREFRVLGCGGVYIIDGSDVTQSNVAEADPNRTLSILNVRLHLLSQGDRFALATRMPHIGPADAVDETLGVDSDGDGREPASRRRSRRPARKR